ncbi:Uncharacterised protein [Vibrio cholerae]|nr:Uncharacterised protein [Vibrio cholerae]
MFAVHVSFNRFPHARHFAFRLNTRERTLLDLPVFFDHFVKQFRVGKRRALRSQVIATVGGVRVKIFLRHTHFS